MSSKKAFSILEILFVVLIISIISSIAIPKLFKNKMDTYIVKAKSEVALIKEAIKKDYSDQVIRQVSQDYIESLDSASSDQKDQKLFSGLEERRLLRYPLISTSQSESKEGKWIKLSEFTYEVVLAHNTKVKFDYDNSDGSFECDSKDEHCLELMQ